MGWKTAWSYLPINYNTVLGSISNITQRTCFRNNLNGTEIKLKFSNRYGKERLILDDVVLGKKKRGRTFIGDSTAVTYEGNRRIVLQPGEEYYSDVIHLTVSDQEDLVLSVYVKETTDISCVCCTWYAKSWNTRYGMDGNYTLDQEFMEVDGTEVYPALKDDPNVANHIFGVTEIKIDTEDDVKTVALFGDSITHMSYYSDALIERLYQSYPGKIAVLNRGIGGNRLLQDYTRTDIVPGNGALFGTAGIERFLPNVYGEELPDYVIVLIGVNDIMHPYVFNHLEERMTLQGYKEGIGQLIETAHRNGSKLFLGTITPFKQIEIDWFKEAEELRQRANDWIRKQSLSDGVIDFDMAVRDKERPEYLIENCHTGDGLHPNAEGGRKMAEAIPLSLFE